MNSQDYFTEHSLDTKFVKENFGWTWTDEKITIPVYDEKGKLLYCKYRHLDFIEKKAAGDKYAKKFSFDTGGKPTLYCQHKIKNQDIVILCEGEPDAIRLWQEKLPAVTPTAGVKTFSEKLASPLKGKIVYILLDTDEAGTSSIRKYYEVLRGIAKDILIIDLPQEVKDISDYFTAGYSRADFEKLVGEALLYEDWLDKHEPKEFALETFEELANEVLPQDEWLIDRVIPVEGFCFIAGAEATGKSFFTLDIAHSLVTGNEWLGKFKVNKQVKVLFIDKENTRRRTQKRLKGLGIENQKDIYRVRYPEHFELINERADDGFSDFARSLSRKVKKLGIGLVVIDSFTDVLVGNENARDDVQKFFDAMRQLFPSVSILVLHHASKPAAGVMRSSSQKFRGSTNITAQLYSGFLVEKVPKSLNEFVFEQTKSGDSEKLNPFIIQLVSETDPENTEKTIVTRLDHNGEIVPEELKTAEAVSAITELFKKTSQIGRSDLINLLQGQGISKGTSERAFKKMRDNDLIKSVPNEENKSKKDYVWNEFAE